MVADRQAVPVSELWRRGARGPSRQLASITRENGHLDQQGLGPFFREGRGWSRASSKCKGMVCGGGGGGKGRSEIGQEPGEPFLEAGEEKGRIWDGFMDVVTCSMEEIRLSRRCPEAVAPAAWGNQAGQETERGKEKGHLDPVVMVRRIAGRDRPPGVPGQKHEGVDRPNDPPKMMDNAVDDPSEIPKGYRGRGNSGDADGGWRRGHGAEPAACSAKPRLGAAGDGWSMIDVTGSKPPIAGEQPRRVVGSNTEKTRVQTDGARLEAHG